MIINIKKKVVGNESIKWGFTKLNKITSHKLYNSANVRCS